MTSTWPYPGSRWWKFDFHTHTPASKDTTGWQSAVGTADEITAEKWLLKFMAAEIDCVAITDHNSGAWIDGLKASYEQLKARAAQGECPEFRELHIFPGVEISVQGGFHLLAIFDLSTSTSDIDTLLGSVGYDGTKGDSDGVTRRGAADVVEAIIDAGGIPIPAHADQSKGLLQVSTGTRQCQRDPLTVKQVLEAEKILAMEWCDQALPTPTEYEKAKARWTRVLGSDCHTFRGTAAPGSRYTWVKMGSATLEGLRLALLDGNQFSIRCSDEGTFDPFQTPASFITSLGIKNARFMGQGKAEQIRFTPFYNSLIGGRGTGKSTAVHALRIGYGRDHELDALDPDSEPRKQFSRFRQVVSGRDGIGALRTTTEICIELMRDGVPHRIAWRPGGENAQVDVMSTDGWRRSDSQALTNERFPIRLFSQGQIAAMAGDNRQALMDVIDDGAHIHALVHAFEDAKRAYLSQSARLRELDGKLSDRAEVQRKRDDTTRKLDTFNSSQYAEILKTYQLTTLQKNDISETLAEFESISGRITNVSTELVLPASDRFDPQVDVEISSWLQDAKATLGQIKASLEDIATSATAFSTASLADPRIAHFDEQVSSAASAFEALKTSLAEQGIQDPEQFSVLAQQSQQLDSELRAFDILQEERTQLIQAMQAQLHTVKGAREAITARRQDFLTTHLQGNAFVRISAVPYGFDGRTIERSLRNLLDVPDDRFERDIFQVEGGEALGLAAELAANQGVIDNIKSRLIDVDTTFNGHFQNFLTRKSERQPEFADHVRCWFPDDDLQIEYSRTGDGTSLTPIEQGSPGQRSAALLAFLLAFGDEPLVLDQPEDDLDNHLIYDLIVQQLRDNKLRRQLVIVTHNANVVVNGDAELVHAFEFGNGQCHVKTRGPLQETAVRKKVCHVMEGGPEAFSKRWARLGREV